jgi:hypothetical protein
MEVRLFMRQMRHVLFLLGFLLLAGLPGASVLAYGDSELRPVQDTEESAAPYPFGDEEEEEDAEAETLFA